MNSQEHPARTGMNYIWHLIQQRMIILAIEK